MVLVGTWCFRCWVGCLGVVAAVGSVGATGGDGRRGLDMMSLSVCASCIGRSSIFGFSFSVVLVSIVSISSLVISLGFLRILSLTCFSFVSFKIGLIGFLFGAISSLAKFSLILMFLDGVVGCMLSVIVVFLIVVVFVVVVCDVSVGSVVEFSG